MIYEVNLMYCKIGVSLSSVYLKSKKFVLLNMLVLAVFTFTLAVLNQDHILALDYPQCSEDLRKMDPWKCNELDHLNASHEYNNQINQSIYQQEQEKHNYLKLAGWSILAFVTWLYRLFFKFKIKPVGYFVLAILAILVFFF